MHCFDYVRVTPSCEVEAEARDKMTWNPRGEDVLRTPLEEKMNTREEEVRKQAHAEEEKQPHDDNKNR